jgi:hypothetical protein
LPYEAEYGVYRNSKKIARATITLEKTGDHLYRYSRVSKGTKGLAALLNAADNESAEFEYVGGEFRPKTYQTQNRVAGRKRGWQANFDWQKFTVSGIDDNEPFELETETGLQDPATFQLTLIQALNGGHQSIDADILDGADITERKYTFSAAKDLSTPIGCTSAIKVDRIRANSNRYTTSWHAPSAGYTVVRLDHGKKGDKTNSMRLERLTINGEAVTFDDECEQP